MGPETDEWEKGTYQIGVAIICVLAAILLAFWSEWKPAVAFTLLAILSFLWGLHYLRAEE
jgi:hypothetical protein